MTTRVFSFCFILLALLGNSVPITEAWANAKLVAHPTRIVLEGRNRGAEITVVNSGNSEGTYRIELIDTFMDPVNGPRDINPGEKYEYSAQEYLRISPRRVTLPPGTNQKIRLLLRKSKDLPDGEYRSHVRIKASYPVDTPSATGENAGKEFMVTLTPRLNLVIPVIFRHGETYFQSAINDIQLVRDTQTGALSHVMVNVAKDGNRSVIGDVDVYYHPTSGSPVHLASLEGLVIYREAPYRLARVPLVADLPENLTLSGGKIRATFTHKISKDKGRSQEEGSIIAEAELPL